MSRSNKRARFTPSNQMVVVQQSARRPIDKLVVVVNKDGVDGTQVSTTLLTVTFPCTVTGLRWSIDFLQDAGTGNAFISWAVVIARDGVTAGTLASSDAASLFDPEQNMLAFGCGAIDNNTDTVHSEGTTKSMRKLMGGDKLLFLAKGVATNTIAIRGIVQFFCKS